jgi:hypothetical protein
MKKSNVSNISLLGFLIISGMLFFQSCEKEHEGCDEDNISITGDDDSHNQGQNCMQCHKNGGEGEGCFVVAGTVYDSLQTSTVQSGLIEFYTEPNGGGQKMKTIEIDSKGNFDTIPLSV